MYKRIVVLLALSLTILTLVRAPQPGMAYAPGENQTIVTDRNAKALLQRTLQNAQRAGTYRFTMDIQQTIAAPASSVGRRTTPAEQFARMQVEGQIDGPQRTRLALRDGEIRGGLPQQPIGQPAGDQEILISGSDIYRREGNAWVLQPESTATPGLTSDALILLDVARDVQRADPIETLAGTFDRLTFTLDSRDVLTFLLQQMGHVNDNAQLLLQLSELSYGGTGELWIDRAGLPARLALDLLLSRGGREPFQAHAISTALYSGFGEPFPDGWFDPTIAPLSQISTSPIPGSGLTGAQLWNTGMMAGLLFAEIALLIALLHRPRLAKRAGAVLSAVLIVTLLAPGVARAAQSTVPVDAPTVQSDAVETMLANAREMGQRQRANVAALAADLTDQGDEDGDGLPNGYELKLGTNPFAVDTDLDGLDDGDEVEGIACTYGESTIMVETDPLNPDTNHDGLRDGDEFDRGECRYTEVNSRPFAWDDDNDSDGVPDSLDLSPFSKSDPMEDFGANLTFETLYNPGTFAPREVYYFEVQIVPTDARSLQYAYKSALEWPLDEEGMIQHNPISGTTGLLHVAPFLEVTLDESDLPASNAMAQYALGSMPLPPEAGGSGTDHTMIIPLAPVERGGKIYALQGKVFQNHPSIDGIIRWRNMRLKWGVQGDVLRANDEGEMVASPTGSYGLIVYEEPYRITGVQTSRQAGASSLVAGEVPTPGEDLDAGPIALLRAGMEAQFLGGRLNLSEIYARFDIGSTASITEQWGITSTFQLSQPRHYQHLDQMLLTTNVTTTRDILNAVYPGGNYTPTLLIATEQRTATLNVDDLPDPNFADLSFNLCLTQMMTSRSLKLAPYRWDPTAGLLSSAPLVPSTGDWMMLGLDEVLADIQRQFDEIYGTLEDFYNETVTILQMAMTVWYQGQTVVQAIGNIDLTDITDALSDPNFYQNILDLLDQYGLLDGLPSEFRYAVEFLLGVLDYPGGPAQWLEDQWNTLVSIGGEIAGGFKDFASGDFDFTPDSLIDFTQTAINVLTWLAAVFDFGFLGDVIKVLSRLLEIFKKVQELWNTIQVMATQGTKLATQVLKTVTGELGSLTQSLQLVGLILSVYSILFDMFLQLATGSLSVLGVIGVVLKAIIDIAIAIVLFVVATIFPIGTIVAIAIGIVLLVAGLLRDYLGDVGEVIAAFLDPIGALMDALNPDPEPLATFFGTPDAGELQFNTFDDAPLGGIVEGDRFGFEMTGTVRMTGSSEALHRSRAWLQLGRHAKGEAFQMCGQQILQHLTQTGHLDSVAKYAGHIADGSCATFYLRSEPGWSYSRDADRQRSGIYTSNKIPGTDIPLPFPFRLRDYHTTARMFVKPYYPRINGVVSPDVTLNVRQLWENCGILGLDCDLWVEKFETPPAVSYIYFDILPRTLKDLWNWEELTNHDPDGDGLGGNMAQGVFGLDNNFCGNPDSHNTLNSEAGSDGLTDAFELWEYESSPCEKDTDGDLLDDGQEFVLGTDPRNPDTDGDGLKDGAEIVRWAAYAHNPSVPWRVDMNGAYPGLPDPIAFPNPRLANADRDPRGDKKEKEYLSSPNAFNVSDIEVAVAQELLQGGGTRIRLTTFPWPNDAAPGLSSVVTLTLPLTLTGVSTSARLVNKVLPALNPQTGTPIPGTPPNVYAWSFPPITLNRLVQIAVAGLPGIIPSDTVSLTVGFAYTEAGVPRQTGDTQPLLINRGGPDVTIIEPVDGDIVSAYYNPIRIQGAADDPEGIGNVEICATTAPACTPADWEGAQLSIFYAYGWSYDWTPPSDGAYNIFARATDTYSVPGPVTGPVTVTVDSTLPSGATFDIEPITYLSTTFSTAALAAFTVTGRISDTTGGAYVSGVGGAQVPARHFTPDGWEYLRGQSIVVQPGATTSAFSTTFSLPAIPLNGAASPYAEGFYELTLDGSDRAGNVRDDSDTLVVIVDDTPPFAYLRVPQTISTTTANLGGRADDTALNLRRSSQDPYPVTQTLTAHDTAITVDNAGDTRGRAFAVGDLNGDAIDDVVAFTWDPAKPLEAGIFFGDVYGYPATLDLSQADVHIMGELDFHPPYTYGPSVAINAPGLLDVNGDAIADLVIGDPNVNGGAGRAYVLLGRRVWPASMDLDEADWRLSLAGVTAFGGSVASAGDVDGDGLTDLLVGAATDDFYYDVAYLYLGRERGVPAVQSRLYGRDCSSGGCNPPLMPNLAGLGDTDGDGLSDFLLAVDNAVFLIDGQPKSQLPAADLAMRHAIANFNADSIQQTVSPAGDVNGDGLRDMLIGAPLISVSRLFVVFGRPPENPFPAPPTIYDLFANADFSFREIVGGVGYPPLGEGLAPMGDLDRDGLDDFAFGRVGFLGGAAIVLSGQTPWLRDMSPVSATNFIFGTSGEQQAGAYLSSGDVNGDAIRDLMVGAPGVATAYLFNGDLPFMVPSGIQQVEIGASGPITDPTLPVSATLPTAWRIADLGYLGGWITPYTATLAFNTDGDYRLYARVIDRAGNRLPSESWYGGTTFVYRDARAIPTLDGALDTPALFREGFLRVAMTGTIASPVAIQQLRIFDGERWTRMPLTTTAPGDWDNESNIERSDRRAITFRAVARDAYGNVAYAYRTVTTDTLVARPELFSNLTAYAWETNVTPTLMITWPVVTDAGGSVAQFATIDMMTDTFPTMPSVGNQVSRALAAPGVWYAHVRVVDDSGNQRLLHDGPYGVNRFRTPSAILPDGWLDFYEAEYTEGMMMSYDPYAAAKPALLLATWDSDTLYLGFTGGDWSTEQRFALYLDTQAGGATTSLGSAMPGGESLHTLPFAADYALVVSGETTATLFSDTGDGWTAFPTMLSLVAVGEGTEIAFDRGEIGAFDATPVSLLAYVATDGAITAILPASGRMTTTDVVTGPLTFADAIHWSSLHDGYPATVADLPVQRIAPMVSVDPGYDVQLNPGDAVTMAVTIINPDVLPYDNHPMTVTVGEGAPDLMKFVSLEGGAACVSCPANASEWVVAVDVNAGESEVVTLTGQAQTPLTTGVFTVPVAATLAYQGLPDAPQPPATADYLLDYSVAKATFGVLGATVYAQPGFFKLSILPELSVPFLTCKQQLSIDKGAGYQVLGDLGTVDYVTETLSSGYSELWQLEVQAENTQVSTDTVLIETDAIVPSVQITPTLIFTNIWGLLKGWAVDNSGVLRAVEVSLNGGTFKRALLLNGGDGQARGFAPQADAVVWAVPLDATGMDGEAVKVVARAVDAAGNVSEDSDPVLVTLDATGPVITVTESLTTAEGTISDGSGVAQVQVSLDGGVTYQDAAVAGGSWSFDYETWSGGAPVGIVVIRARDIYGNVAQTVAPTDFDTTQYIYLPLVMRSGS